MRVLGWSRSGRTVEGVETVALDFLLERSDFVSIHVALTPETRGLLGRDALGRMRRGAVLVNTARGGIVDEVAVAQRLESGDLAAAAFDVFEDEPVTPDNPLLTAPNTVLTPHVGSATIATRVRMADLCVENLLAGLDGAPMPHCANADRLA
jgi:glyoxylate reductase